MNDGSTAFATAGIKKYYREAGPQQLSEIKEIASYVRIDEATIKTLPEAQKSAARKILDDNIDKNRLAPYISDPLLKRRYVIADVYNVIKFEDAGIEVVPADIQDISEKNEIAKTGRFDKRVTPEFHSQLANNFKRLNPRNEKVLSLLGISHTSNLSDHVGNDVDDILPSRTVALFENAEQYDEWEKGVLSGKITDPADYIVIIGDGFGKEAAVYSTPERIAFRREELSNPPVMKTPADIGVELPNGRGR